MAQKKQNNPIFQTIFKKFLAISLISAFAVSLVYHFTPFTTVYAQNADNLAQKSPNYFYNRESAFILKNALDTTNGGMYLAVNKNGDKINDLIPGEVWAYKEDSLRGTDKTQVGQATCIRYFINEYLRTNQNGVEGINDQLPKDKKLSSAVDLLKKGKTCADFAINKMEISADEQKTTVKPDSLFYWGVVSADGSKKFDDASPENTTQTYRSESSLSWTMAEYALAMKQAGLSQAEYAPYQNAATRWWNWRKNTAIKLREDFNRNMSPGAGRDMYYPALGFALAELTGDNQYRDGDGTTNSDGSQYGAAPFANSQLGTGLKPSIPFTENKFALQEKTYTAALPRGTIFAKHDTDFPNNLQARDQWWDFGWEPLVTGQYPNYSLKAAYSYTDTQLSQAFMHSGGRELLAGVLKSLWFYSTYGANPEMYYVKDNVDKNKFTKPAFAKATQEYWNLINEKLWDDTPGQAAWLEATNAPYKPCFSGDNDIPFGDWKKPTIGDKVHALNADNSSTVTVSGVTDDATPYLSIAFAGSGIQKVEIVYTTNKGQNWITIPASFNGTNYTSTIPPVSPGTTVYYYAKAVDNFNNWTAFPTGSETWNDANVTISQDYTKAQTYTIPARGFGGDAPTDPVVPANPSVPAPSLPAPSLPTPATPAPAQPAVPTNPATPTTPVTNTPTPVVVNPPVVVDPAVKPISSISPTATTGPSPSTTPARPPSGFGGDAPATTTPSPATPTSPSTGLIRTGGRDN